MKADDFEEPLVDLEVRETSDFPESSVFESHRRRDCIGGWQASSLAKLPEFNGARLGLNRMEAGLVELPAYWFR